MNNILIRSITGAVFISVILLPLFFSEIITSIVLGLFMTLALIEFYRLFNNNDQVQISWEIGTVFGVLIYSTVFFVFFNHLPKIALPLLIPLFFILMSFEIWKKKKNPVLNIAVLLLGILYVVVPFILMLAIDKIDQGYFPLLAGMFLLIWMNDTFAYLSGRFFGRRKLIERISPNKTWEGTIGGLIFTLIGGAIIGFFMDPDHLLFWLISSFLIGPLAAIGDLLESLIKRNLKVKDSGSLLPGHGGVLDRFDASLLTTPFFFVWTLLYLYF